MLVTWQPDHDSQNTHPFAIFAACCNVTEIINILHGLNVYFRNSITANITSNEVSAWPGLSMWWQRIKCVRQTGLQLCWRWSIMLFFQYESLNLMPFVARVRGDPPLLQSAMDIYWRLRFSRLRQAPSRKAWYSSGPVKSKIIASYVHENFYLWYFILPQIMVFPCSINITARLACTNNHTCSTDSLARLIIGFKSTK